MIFLFLPFYRYFLPEKRIQAGIFIRVHADFFVQIFYRPFFASFCVFYSFTPARRAGSADTAADTAAARPFR